MSYPNFDTHGFSWPGGPDYEPPPPPRCHCGRFLPWKSIRTEYEEYKRQCDGVRRPSQETDEPFIGTYWTQCDYSEQDGPCPGHPHEWVEWISTIHVYQCSAGHEHKEVD